MEFVIVVWIDCWIVIVGKVDSTLVHARAFTHALKGGPREMRTVNLV